MSASLIYYVHTCLAKIFEIAENKTLILNKIKLLFCHKQCTYLYYI